jgi:hypothetical protein
MKRIEDFLLRPLEDLSIIEIERILSLLTQNLSYHQFEDEKFFKLEKRKAELLLERLNKAKAKESEYWTFKKMVEYCTLILDNFDYMTPAEREHCYEFGKDYSPKEKRELLEQIEKRKKSRKWKRDKIPPKLKYYVWKKEKDEKKTKNKKNNLIDKENKKTSSKNNKSKKTRKKKEV